MKKLLIPFILFSALASAQIINPGGSGGVTTINGTAGAFTFNGTGVSCTTTTCTFSSSGGGDTITSPNSTLGVGGTAGATTLDVLGSAGKILGGATPALTFTPALGVDGTNAGTLQLANGAAAFHTILGSVASANNTVNFFATAPTTGDLVDCVTATTTCTLTDAGVLAANVVTAGSAAGAANQVAYSAGASKALSYATLDNTTTHAFFATAGAPAFRAIASGDIPTLNQNTTGSAASLSVSGQTGLITLTGITSTNRAITVRDAADTMLELGGSYTPTGTWTSMTLVTPSLGTPASGVITSLTGTCGSCVANSATSVPAANVASGALVSGMTATTQSPGDNSTKLATTAFVLANGAGFSPTTFQSSAVTTNIAAANIVASAGSTKLYHFDWEVSLTVVGASCTGSTTVIVNAVLTDPNTSTPQTVALGTITIASLGNGTLGYVADGSEAFYVKTGTALQYSTTSYTAGSGCATNPTYQVTGEVF